MAHPLKQRLGKLRSRVRLLLALYGLSWVVGSVLLSVLLVGLLDYLVRFQDPGIRLFGSLAVLTVFGWTSYRHLYLPLTIRLRDVDLARGLERWYPALDDSLASAVEFLDQPEDDPTAGSLALRRAVIVKTAAETELLDFDQALQRRPARRAALAATAIALVALIVATASPTAARIALARLANPFGQVSWPQMTHLMLRQRVERVARGQAFEIEVVDRYGAKLPEQAQIFYRFEDADGRVTEENEPMHILGDALIARRENVTRPFSYRVEGGDDRSMPWLPVEVVDPPAVESLSIALIPPAYTGWPREEVTGHLRALIGTRAILTGQATKPLRSAVLCLEDGRQLPARIEGGGRRFTIPAAPDTELIVEKSGAYWFQLTDTEDLTGGDEIHWEIRAVPDNPPTVAIEQPTATVFVTPQAVVPLRVVAKDDLAVARVDLQFSRSDQEGASTLSLFAGPERVAPRSSGLSGTGDLGESRVVTHAWELDSLGLTPGVQVTFHATAADYKPQTGQSEPARLAVITPEELADRIASRQAFILAELTRVLQMQRQSRDQVATLEIRAGQIGRLDRLDIDRLRGAELNQRQVNRTLTSRSEGVPMHILGLLDDLANNKVDSPDVERRMQGLLEEIDRLSRDHLPVIGRELTSAIKTAQIELQDQTKEPPQAGEASAVADPLAAAGAHQDQVIAALEQMLRQLSRWDNYRRFHREIGQLLRSQEELNRHTLELARRTLAKELRDLLPQEQADLKVAAREQSELARQLDRLVQGMAETADALRKSDPLAADTVRDALDRARELAIGATMRSTGDRIEQNRMGQATSQQKQVVENLQEILDILANRRESELARLVEKLREAQQDLAHLAERQEAVQKRMDEAAGHPESQQRQELQALAAEQEALREDTEQLMRRLERLMAERVADTAQQAAEKMGQAAQAAQEGSAKAASFQAHQAKEILDEALRQLAERRRQADAELAMEQLAQLRDALQSVHGRQEKALEETRRLQRLRQEQGDLSRAQASSLFDLARQQKSLQADTQALADNLAAAAVFHLVLRAAADEMGRAAALLDRRQTDAATQQAEQEALRRLAQVLEAMKPAAPEKTQDGNSGGQGGKGEATRGEAIRNYAQLKLLRLLQEDLNRRTRELHQRLEADPSPSPELRREQAALAEEQGRLANLLISLLQPEDEEEELP